MTSVPFQIPFKTSTDQANERRVGFEIEFTGVGLAETAHLIQALFWGLVRAHHRFHFTVEATSLGDFEINSDASFVNQRKWEPHLTKLGFDVNSTSVGEEFVPFEIASPPIPFSKMFKIERLRERLQAAGAIGTHAHNYSAFGLQFNPEMPDLRRETLLAYMRAFFISYDALLASEDILLSRKLLPYIDPFSVEFIRQILDPAYVPSLNGQMRDYLEQNATRNRPLDWLPLFAYINKDLVFEYPIEKELVRPRPTLHYRLPSSLIDDPNWPLSLEWNTWAKIDNLAQDPERICERSKKYLSHSASHLSLMDFS